MINFSFSEFLNSDTAKKNNINNLPDISSFDNLLYLIVFCLQPIRNLINKPIIITSGYRCANLNKILGGAVNSQHLNGQAADFIVKNMTPEKIINIILKSDIKFDQLINEHDKWVHISYNKEKNRHQVFKIK